MPGQLAMRYKGFLGRVPIVFNVLLFTGSCHYYQQLELKKYVLIAVSKKSNQIAVLNDVPSDVILRLWYFMQDWTAQVQFYKTLKKLYVLLRGLLSADLFTYVRDRPVLNNLHIYKMLLISTNPELY